MNCCDLCTKQTKLVSGMYTTLQDFYEKWGVRVMSMLGVITGFILFQNSENIMQVTDILKELITLPRIASELEKLRGQKKIWLKMIMQNSFCNKLECAETVAKLTSAVTDLPLLDKLEISLLKANCQYQHMRSANYYRLLNPTNEPQLPDNNDFVLLEMGLKDVEIALLKYMSDIKCILEKQ